MSAETSNSPEFILTSLEQWASQYDSLPLPPASPILDKSYIRTAKHHSCTLAAPLFFTAIVGKLQYYAHAQNVFQETYDKLLQKSSKLQATLEAQIERSGSASALLYADGLHEQEDLVELYAQELHASHWARKDLLRTAGDEGVQFTVEDGEEVRGRPWEYKKLPYESGYLKNNLSLGRFSFEGKDLMGKGKDPQRVNEGGRGVSGEEDWVVLDTADKCAALKIDHNSTDGWFAQASTKTLRRMSRFIQTETDGAGGSGKSLKEDMSKSLGHDNIQIPASSKRNDGRSFIALATEWRRNQAFK